jgi:hypothetical protein
MPIRFWYDIRFCVPDGAGFFALLRLRLCPPANPDLPDRTGVNPATATAVGQARLTKFAVIEEMGGAV